MDIISTITDIREKRNLLPEPVGLVPTMGYLHEGHLSLIRAAKADCESIVVSIFVNPAQFGLHEDFKNYPRNINRDIEMLANEGVSLVWLPEAEIMYPRGYRTWIHVEEITETLEGERRPGHFTGVATIVAKLFNAVQPQRAYFGQKDAQQVAVLRQMTRDLNLPVQITVCPTLREADGLAMSSRNIYLRPDERVAAAVLYRSLREAEKAYRDGVRNAQALREIMQTVLSTEPLARVDYVSCADRETLRELDSIEQGGLLSLAVYIGKTRLIDNIVIDD